MGFFLIPPRRGGILLDLKFQGINEASEISVGNRIQYSSSYIFRNKKVGISDILYAQRMNDFRFKKKMLVTNVGIDHVHRINSPVWPFGCSFKVKDTGKGQILNIPAQTGCQSIFWNIFEIVVFSDFIFFIAGYVIQIKEPVNQMRI